MIAVTAVPGAVQCYVLAILFMSQASGIHLDPQQLFMAILLSCLMCMGTIVVPGGMVVTYTFLATMPAWCLQAQASGFLPNSCFPTKSSKTSMRDDTPSLR
jgi:Na+/H+-dicarboxylate symporter